MRTYGSAMVGHPDQETIAMPLLQQHPLGDELEAFALGRLDDAQCGTVEAHVGTCPDCEAIVSRIAGDPFTELLRSVQSVSDTPTMLTTEATGVEPQSGTDD